MSTQITTSARTRFSYVHVFNRKTKPNGEPGKYSVTLLIPKNDTETLSRIKAAIAEAKANYLERNPGKKLPEQIKTVVYDGDGIRPNGEDFGPECAGHVVFTASSSRQPAIVDKNLNPIMDPEEIYSGCYGKAIVNFYVYDTEGNRGVSAWLNGIMKCAEGEPLGGSRELTADDWAQGSDWVNVTDEEADLWS